MFFSFTTQLDAIAPPEPIIDISEESALEMNRAMSKLTESGLPLLEIAIDQSTGLLNVVIDSDSAMDDTEDEIRKITADIGLDITYGLDDARFHSSCNQYTKLCDPLIGGSIGEDEY